MKQNFKTRIKLKNVFQTLVKNIVDTNLCTVSLSQITNSSTTTRGFIAAY